MNRGFQKLCIVSYLISIRGVSPYKAISDDNIVLTFNTCEPWKFKKEITTRKKYNYDEKGGGEEESKVVN